MRVLIILVMCFCLSCCIEEDQEEDNEVQFESSTSNFKIIENSTVTLPCYLENMENTTTVWFRNGELIADSTRILTETPSNVKVLRNYVLQISNIKRSESGVYSCQISAGYLNKPAKQDHLVNVLFPPTIYPDPSTGGLDVEFLHGFILACEVTGNPQPRIKWYFEWIVFWTLGIHFYADR